MEKKATELETLTPITSGAAVHTDGDHQCIVPYFPVKEGQDVCGSNLFAARGDGTFERVAGTGSVHGPAQVATPEYRESWERTFNSKGGEA